MFLLFLLLGPEGIRHDLPGSQARVRMFESPLYRYINVWHCGGLSMVFLQLKDPMELLAKSRGLPTSSGFLSRRVKT